VAAACREAREVKSALLPLALFGIAFVLGTHVVRAYRANGGVQDFYQYEFGPAVMLACGRGYHPPDATKLPELSAFLRLQQDRFDCATLPAVAPLYPALNPFQRVSRYLLMSVAATWLVVGVSWSRLAVFGGLLYAVVITLTYAIARVALGRGWAVASVVPLLWSPLAFSVLPNYRDYAKAPFILAMILVTARLVVGDGRAETVFGLAALGGLIAGVGLGFRNDILITIVPLVIALLALAPVAMPRAWLVRLAATAVFALTFAVVARPVLADYSEGSNTGHVALLGLMTPFDGPLGIERPIYDLGAGYDDGLAFEAIDSYAQRMERRSVVLGSSEYDSAAFGYLGHVARTMPGDVLTRALAAIRGVPLFVLRNYLSPPEWAQSKLVDQLYYARALILPRVSRLAAIAVAIAIFCVAGRSIRAGIMLLLLLAIFVGSTGTQFHERHFFHLEFLPYWALAFLGQSAVAAWWAPPRRAEVVLACKFAVVCAVVLGSSLAAARAYQDHQVRGVLEAYLRAPRQPLTSQARKAADGLATAFVVADLGGDRCPAGTIAVTLHGPGKRTVQAHVDRATGEPTRVFFAAYSPRDDERTALVTVDESAGSCLERVDRVDPAGMPLLLNATLEPHWRDGRLHQRLVSIF
jgi:hypothetical protein